MIAFTAGRDALKQPAMAVGAGRKPEVKRKSSA
jgi:hypothetical protein